MSWQNCEEGSFRWVLYHLHWSSSGIFPKVLLLLLSYLYTPVRIWRSGWISALSSLASTHHSVLGTAVASLKLLARPWRRLILLAWPFWLVLGVWCWLCALGLALALYQFRKYLNADQCDVVQSILLKEGCGRFDVSAEMVILRGLLQDASPHTNGFLWAGMGFLKLRQGASGTEHAFERVLDYTVETEDRAQRAEDTHALRQTIRLWNMLACYHGTVGNQEALLYCRSRALVLARTLAADDQRFKIS